MGGTKKKSLGASAKSQDAGPQATEVKKDDKKDKKEKGAKGPQQKARISVVLNEGQGMKALADLKAITPQALARNTGVKISVANEFIQSAESKGIVKYVGGYSGHKVYAMVQEISKKQSVKEEVQPKQEVPTETSVKETG
jgi:small subunit ribosomal protein S25e